MSCRPIAREPTSCSVIPDDRRQTQSVDNVEHDRRIRGRDDLAGQHLQLGPDDPRTSRGIAINQSVVLCPQSAPAHIDLIEKPGICCRESLCPDSVDAFKDGGGPDVDGVAEGSRDGGQQPADQCVHIGECAEIGPAALRVVHRLRRTLQE